MPFNLFHKKKQPEQQILTAPAEEQLQQSPQEITPQEAPVEQPQSTPEAAPAPEPVAPTPEPVAPVEEPKAETTPEPTPAAQENPQAAAGQEQPQEAPAPQAPETPKETPAPIEQTVEQPKPVPTEPANKTYLKAMPLKDLADVETVKNEVRNGNIIILRITPLAGKSIEDVKTAVNDLFQFAETIQGDIARLGEERIVICPKPIRIWREKTPAPVTNKGPLPTAA